MTVTFPVYARELGVHRQAGTAQSANYTSRLLLAVAALLVATQLRAAHVLENRFHQDEALYATFARFIASGPGRGLLLSHMLVDKPPLAFYLNGLSVAIFGGSEFALRLPTLLASTVSVALIFALGRRLYGEMAAHAAAWAMALSPFAIQFSITIFVDPLLTTWLLAAMLLLVRGRLGWAALALSLAWATKQTALLFIPLALLVGLVSLPHAARLRQAALYLLRALLPVIAGVSLVTLLLIAWDQRRAAPISIFQQGYSDNIYTRLAGPQELKPRADALLAILYYFSGNDLISALFLAGLVLLLVNDARHGSRAAWVDALLVTYQLGYVAGYWLVSLNLFDRYFLPILPLWALLFGRVFDVATQWLTPALDWLARRAGQARGQAARAARLTTRVALPLTVLAILVPMTAAANYDFSPIGGDHGAYDGVDDAAGFIHTLPRGSVLYDHWLSWEFDYYLFDRPVETFYYPDTQTLSRDLAQNRGKKLHYLVLPWWAQDLDLRPAAAQAGFALRPIHQSYRRDGVVSLTIYQLEPVQ